MCRACHPRKMVFCRFLMARLFMGLESRFRSKTSFNTLGGGCLPLGCGFRRLLELCPNRNAGGAGDPHPYPLVSSPQVSWFARKKLRLRGHREKELKVNCWQLTAKQEKAMTIGPRLRLANKLNLTE